MNDKKDGPYERIFQCDDRGNDDRSETVEKFLKEVVMDFVVRDGRNGTNQKKVS